VNLWPEIDPKSDLFRRAQAGRLTPREFCVIMNVERDVERRGYLTDENQALMQSLVEVKNDA